MRQLSPKTRALLADLARSRSRVFGSQSHQESLLEEIADSGETAALPSLIGWTLSLDPRIRDAAVLAASRLVEATPSYRLPSLDELMRTRVDWKSPWSELRQLEFHRFKTEDRALLLRLSTMHGNGFLRQAAVEQLIETPSSADLPFLAVRLNDWVAEVRKPARSGVKAILRDPRNAEALVAALPLFSRLANCGRGDSSTILDAVETFLRHQESLKALGSALGGPDRVVSRTAFEFGVRLDSSLEFFRLALQARDPIIRFRAVRLVLEKQRDELYPQVFGSLGSDSYFPIRRIILESCEDFDRDRGFERLKVRCLDRSRSIRTHCQQRLMFDFDFDVCEIYRDLARHHTVRSRIAALQGLREVGGENDTMLAIDYLDARSPKVRAAALALIARFDAVNHRDRLVAGLLDPSPNVQRTAMRALESSDLVLSDQEIRQLFREAQPTSKAVVLRVAKTHLDSWDYLCFLLEAGRDSDEFVAETAQALLRSKLAKSRGLGYPGPARFERVRLQLELSRPTLDARVLQGLDFIVRMSSRA